MIGEVVRTAFVPQPLQAFICVCHRIGVAIASHRITADLWAADVAASPMTTLVILWPFVSFVLAGRRWLLEIRRVGRSESDRLMLSLFVAVNRPIDMCGHDAYVRRLAVTVAMS